MCSWGLATSKSGAVPAGDLPHQRFQQASALEDRLCPPARKSTGASRFGLTSGYALALRRRCGRWPDRDNHERQRERLVGPTTVPTTSPITMSSAVAMGNTVNFATVTSAGEQYLNCVYPCATTSTPLTLARVGSTLRQRRPLDQQPQWRGVHHGDLPQQPRRGLVCARATTAGTRGRRPR